MARGLLLPHIKFSSTGREGKYTYWAKYSWLLKLEDDDVGGKDEVRTC